MTKDEIRGRLRSFIEESFLYMRSDFELGDDDSLMGKGVVDSMGVVEVLSFIEETFGIRIPDDDVTERNLGTLNATATYIAEALRKAGK